VQLVICTTLSVSSGHTVFQPSAPVVPAAMGASQSSQYAIGMADALVKVGAYTEEAVPVSDYVEEEFAADIRYAYRCRCRCVRVGLPCSSHIYPLPCQFASPDPLPLCLSPGHHAHSVGGGLVRSRDTPPFAGRRILYAASPFTYTPIRRRSELQPTTS